MLPSAPAQGEDLSFLEGCWYSQGFPCIKEIAENYELRTPGRVEYCFDRQGQGTLTFRRERLDGTDIFESSLQAYFDQQRRLNIRTEKTNLIRRMFSVSYVCATLIAVTTIQNAGLSGTTTTLDELCCSVHTPQPITLRRGVMLW
jgi:hypothetical protein